MNKKPRKSGIHAIGNKRDEELLNQTEQHLRLKQKSIFSPSEEIESPDLANIIDVPAVQSLMDDFYKFAPITMALVDLTGNVLVSVGWQDICTRFHRVNPETCKHCVESDTKLSAGVLPGEFKLYRCKNNMWDIATPIMVGGKHIGNIFSGQFFFEDEPLDYEIFRLQAKKYGFNEEEYIAALEKVPRLSRETVDRGMTFLTKLAHMISQLSYSNTKLAQSLVERNTLVDALRESEKCERARSDELEVLLDAVPTAVWIAHDSQALQITGNRLSYEWLRIPQGSNVSRSAQEGDRPETFRVFKDGIELSPADMPLHVSAAGKELLDYEFEFVYPEGKVRYVLGNARPLKDDQGKPRGSVAAFIDITERKQAEKELIKRENEFRTLAENSPDVIARFDRQKRYMYINPAGSTSGYSPEEIIGKTSGELGIDPEIVKLWEEQIENVFTTGKPEEMEYRYKSPQGNEYYFNTRIVPEFTDDKVVSALAISRDITDTKRAEAKSKETLDNLEKLVKDRTEELEKAYNFLKESEESLSEAQKMAHMGNWEWNIVDDKAYWSDEMYRIFRRDPKKLAPPYDEYLSYIHPDDRDLFDSATKRAVSGKPYSIEYRIILPEGEERIIHMQSQVVFDENNTPVRIKGIIQDITERKKAERALVNLEIARKKEIHHRIKNNLQVISSLLDLQAENLRSRKCVKDSDILNAFRESQDRIMSIALIHEELHEGGGNNTLYFSPYLEKLVENLFQTYNIGNVDISLNMDLEDSIFFDMDTAVPLGIIVNELISNSLKHAFKGRSKGEIRIKLHRDKKIEEGKPENEISNDEKSTVRKCTGYTLIVSDDGTGIPERIDFENSDTLGLQLVNILVDQLDGEIELKRGRGTEVIIKINLQQSSERPPAGRAEPQISDTSI